MVYLLKNDRERKIKNTKEEDLCIVCIFILGLAARVDRLFSHCKYIKTETRNRLTLRGGSNSITKYCNTF